MSAMEHAAASTSHNNSDTGYAKDIASEFKEERFKSKEDLREYAQRIGRSNGFDIVILNSDSGRGKKRARVILGCARSGKPDKRVKHSAPKKCECPFRIKGEKLATEENEWKLTVVEGMHNHPEGQPEGGHSFAGKLSPKMKSLLREMKEKDASPKEIFNVLKKMDVDNQSTQKNIDNELQRLKVVEKKEMQQCLSRYSKLSEYSFIMRERSGAGINARDFFWTHPTSLGYLRTFPSVLMMTAVDEGDTDCTVHITGFTSTELSFFVANAYLSSRMEDNFVWALKTLRAMMDGFAVPDVILTDRDHVGLENAIQNVFGESRLLLLPQFTYLRVGQKCSTIFEADETGFLFEKWEVSSLVESDDEKFMQFMGKWKALLQSPTEAAYEKEWEQLQSDFSMYPQALEYVGVNWKPDKSRFVAAWTNRYMHFGTISWDYDRSSTVLHDMLKADYYENTNFKGIGKVPLDEEEFEQILKEIHDSVELEHTKIEASFQKSLAAAEMDDFRDIPEFKDLLGCVSISALKLILAQWRQACEMINTVDDSTHERCGCAIRDTHGLPCCHKIAEYKRVRQAIPLDCINQHWRKLKREPWGNDAECGVNETMKRCRLSETDAPTSSALPPIEVGEAAEDNPPLQDEEVVLAPCHPMPPAAMNKRIDRIEESKSPQPESSSKLGSFIASPFNCLEETQESGFKFDDISSQPNQLVFNDVNDSLQSAMGDMILQSNQYEFGDASDIMQSTWCFDLRSEDMTSLPNQNDELTFSSSLYDETFDPSHPTFDLNPPPPLEPHDAANQNAELYVDREDYFTADMLFEAPLDPKKSPNF